MRSRKSALTPSTYCRVTKGCELKSALLGLSRNTQGILCLIGAIAILTISDSIIKWLSPSLPLHEIMLIRALIATAFLFILIQFEGGLKALKTERPLLHMLRGSMLVLANMFFSRGSRQCPWPRP